MDNPHHQWHFRSLAPRPPPLPPQANSICPVCSNFHFPFCPPHPPPPSYPHQNPTFPPHPGFDPRPWHDHSNPNFDRRNCTQPVHDYYGSTNGFVGECGWNSNKRMRVDENNFQVTSEDERRLKLIRDHGGNGAENAPFLKRNVFNPIKNHVDYNLVHVNDWKNYSFDNQRPPQSIPLFPPSQHVYGNFNVQGGYFPPLPQSPPPPIPVEPPPLSPASPKASLFPVHESRNLPVRYPGESQLFPLRQLSMDKPKVVNALHLFKQPHRATRADHFVIILRGLPGSGKSYFAKMLRDFEVENGGDAPRIHSMDDYFMTEVEKIEEGDVSKSSGSLRSKKPVTKTVMEYCYEPEMEEAYRSSMLKAFTRTLDEGNFTFVIVDDRNLRVADFAQFWASAKRSGYEVYILEATYKDPAGCAARNVHGFTVEEIGKMAEQWEETPALYLQLDIKTLFHGDNLKESGIKEVEMDMDDVDSDGLSALQEREPNSIAVSRISEDVSADSPRIEKQWDAEGNYPADIVKDLGRSKWSNDLDEVDDEISNVVKGNLNALSGLFQMYGKEGKSVQWGDQVGVTGFSIGGVKNARTLSLVIGPGAGYNLKSNPFPLEEGESTQSTGKSKKQGVFQERLRAEHESFKAVFDRKRQRIGGLDLEDEQ